MIEIEKPTTTTVPRINAAQVLWLAISWQEVKPSASGTTQVPVSKNASSSAPSPTNATVASIAAESLRTVVLGANCLALGLLLRPFLFELELVPRPCPNLELPELFVLGPQLEEPLGSYRARCHL